VTVFSLNDISGLRRPKSVKFDTKAASSTGMMHTLGVLESFLIVAKFAKKCPKQEVFVMSLDFFILITRSQQCKAVMHSELYLAT